MVTATTTTTTTAPAIPPPPPAASLSPIDTAAPKRRRRKSVFRCSQCGAMFRLPLWSRESGQGPVCDACSSGAKTCPDNSMRPQERSAPSDKPAPRMRGRKRRSQHAEDAICANCQTTNTPLWRRDADGNAICNACGLYYKLHMVHRPITMMTTEIKRRKRSSDKKRANRKDGDEDDNHGEQQPQRANEQESNSQQPKLLSSSSSTSSHHFPGSPVSSRGSISTSSAGPSSPVLESSFLLPPLSPMASPQHLTAHSSSSAESQHNTKRYLLEKRHGLQQQVARLSAMLSDTIAMIEDIDTSLATAQRSPSPPACHPSLPRPEDAAKSLLSLARLPPPSAVLSSPPMRPHHRPSSSAAALPRLPPITAVSSSPPPPFEFS